MASSSKPGGSGGQSPESYHSLNKRNTAAEILQSYEKLSWYSAQRCESLAQTRIHFQNILAGFTDDDEAGRVDWRNDNTPHPPRPGEESRVRGKGKERVSSGVHFAEGVEGGSPGGGKARGSGGNGGESAKKKRRSGGGDGSGGE